MKHSIVTIGVFDGVHVGHAAVIKKVVRRAELLGLKSIAVTFDPHPLKVLSKKHFVPTLISVKHRIKLLKGLGIDKVLVMRFDRRMASMSAKKFIEYVIAGKLMAREVFVGEDFRFGRRQEADAERLKAIGRPLGIKVTVVRHVKIGADVVSSSLIRKYVISGRTGEASLFLGRPYSVLGTVVSGSKLGRKLGYPTANINPHHEAVPPSGVYAVKVNFRGKKLDGILNIGIRPTFYDHGRDKEPSIEAHIFDFHRDIYKRTLEIVFVNKIRDEKKFKTVDDLVAQIRKDEIAARRILKKGK